MKRLMWLGVVLSLLLLAGCAGGPKRLEPTKAQKAEGHYSIGVSYLREPNPSLALKEFLQADALVPNDPDTQAGLAQAYEMKKAYGLAEEHYQKAIRLKPDDPYYKNNLGALYIRMERWAEAVAPFEAAATNLLFPESEVAFTGMGYAYHQLGEYDKAVKAYQKAVEQNPKYKLAWLRMGETRFAQGQVDKAIEDYEETIRLAPKWALAHYRLALAYLKQRRTEDARAAFEKTVELAPTSRSAHEAGNYLNILK